MTDAQRFLIIGMILYVKYIAEEEYIVTSTQREYPLAGRYFRNGEWKVASK